MGFTYDEANRRSTLTLPNGITAEYAYDRASQIKGITYKLGTTLLGDLTYGYDEAGRRTQMGGSLARTGLPQALSAAAYDAANELTQWGSTTLTYDGNGNLTNDGVDTYAWNVRNQLTSISGGTTASFQYDASGRRIVRGGTTFFYDGVNPIQELSAGAPTANMLTGLSVDEFFTRTDSSGASHFLRDALGSTLALSDPTGALQTQYTYEPFGNTTSSGPASSNPFQYTGRENDGTGLYYYRARYYNPTTGRFMTEDPLGFVGGINFYAYTGNNPITRIDPFGLDWVYSQSTGQMTHIDNRTGVATPAGTGYSGHGQGLNDPESQSVGYADDPQNTGPLPQGTYTIGNQQTNVTGTGAVLPGSMRLTPDPSNDMFGRAGFLIHGGNMTTPRSSRGCIVLPPNFRNAIGHSGDRVLRVVP